MGEARGRGIRGPVAELTLMVLPPAAYRAVLKERAAVEPARRHGRGGGNPGDRHRRGGGVAGRPVAPPAPASRARGRASALGAPASPPPVGETGRGRFAAAAA